MRGNAQVAGRAERPAVRRRKTLSGGSAVPDSGWRFPDREVHYAILGQVDY
jgi:hypothetical protein